MSEIYRTILSFLLVLGLACGDDSAALDAEQLDAPSDAVLDTPSDGRLDADPSDAPADTSRDTNITFDELKAFPTAYGAGAYTTGGRGGQVIHVTTLEWDAPGGLLEAIETTGPRTIVFDVSGVIDMSTRHRGAIVTAGLVGGARTDIYDNLTIAGQSAPEGGITLQGGNFVLNQLNNVIIRYIRFRNGGDTTQNDDTFSCTGCRDVILDHCTFSHGGDEALDFTSAAVEREVTNLTVQYSFMQDSKTGAILGDCTQFSNSNISSVRNLWSNISHRFPNTCGGGQHDIINNVIFNHKTRGVRFTGAHNVNLIGNYFRTSDAGIRQPSWFPSPASIAIRMHKVQVTDDIDQVRIFSSDTFITGQPQVTDERELFSAFVTSTTANENDPVPARYFVDAAYPILGASYEVLSAEDAYALVAEEAGATRYLNADGSVGIYRDDKDTADVLVMRNDTYGGEFYTPWSMIDYPELPSNTRPAGYDTDGDGMPNEWEALVGLNPDIDDSAADRNSDGYTNLEEFLYQVDL